MSGWAAAGQAVAQLAGAYMQGEATKDAAAMQAQATRQGIEEGQRQYNQTRADTLPWRSAGSSAVRKISDLLGLGSGRTLDEIKQSLLPKYTSSRLVDGGLDNTGAPMAGGYVSEVDQTSLEREAQKIYEQERGSGVGGLTKPFTVADFWDDPVTKLGYQSGLDEGTKGLRNVASASGMRNSGQTLKALTQYATDYTGKSAGDAYNRFYADQDRIFNRLSGVAGTGQTATINTAALGAQNAKNVGDLLTAGANARGAASIAGANAWGNAINNIGNYYNSNQQLDKYLASRNQNQTATNSSWYNDNAPS